MYVDIHALFSAELIDAVTHATDELPDQPSGEFVVLLNRDRHRGAGDQLALFFSGGDAGVIMSDVECMVIGSDAAATRLAERFQLRLPENQMSIKRQSGLLLVSKAENTLFDVIIISKEFADHYKLQTDFFYDDIALITVKGT
jgi:hypothetical protein